MATFLTAVVSPVQASVGHVTTDNGLAYAATYAPWGTPTVSVGESAAPQYGFTGEEQNPTTGLTFLRARYYNPTVGRFTQPDILRGSLSTPGSLNRYAYALGDPVNRSDPSGMFSIGGLFNAVKTGLVNHVVKPVAHVASAAASTNTAPLRKQAADAQPPIPETPPAADRPDSQPGGHPAQPSPVR
ncbi:MAG: RHS repeat-associated core domain-containing protein [Cellulomonadaceae bacterium]|nr:RHS repeat-associated core domain-containing protein [Cellulomonadaceae bacterium]